MLQIVLTIATLLSTALTLILLCLPKQYGAQAAPIGQQSKAGRQSKRRSTSVQILVLGDLGRSPRMQYHALSIAKHGGSVQVIGYLDNDLLPELISLKNVSIVPLSGFPKALQTSNKLLFLALAPAKVLFQVCNLWWVLGYKTVASEWLLVQNPPSIPTLMMASVVCFLRHTRLVIDWHNFGYSILALKLGSSHLFVRISRLYERCFARVAFGHFAVTNVMASLLQTEYVGTAPVMALHDRPSDLFKPLSERDRAEFLCENPLTRPHYEAMNQGKVRLVVSSTSWTPDEDFEVLLKALCQYSAATTSATSRLPKLLVIITGKGPQKDHYLRRINELEQAGKLGMVSIHTAWLSFGNYARLLAAADLGVSLHTSSSGVDLPMKVVDMFGAGLPVVGFDNFKAWPELVTEGTNGRGFVTAEQMSTILQDLFQSDSKQLSVLKQGALQQSLRRWDAEWDPVAGRYFGLVT